MELERFQNYCAKKVTFLISVKKGYKNSEK